MADTLVPPHPADRIEASALGERAADVIAKVRRTGEPVDIVTDGVAVARLVPVADADISDRLAPSVIGMSRGTMSLVSPGDLLEDLLTPEEIDEYYSGEIDPPSSRTAPANTREG
jgi:prevent-host-death family protein